MAVLVFLLFSGFGGCRINWWLIGFIHLYGLHIRTHSNMSEFISKSPSGAFLKLEHSGPFRNSWKGRNCLVNLSLLLWDCCLLKQESSVSLTQVIPASWLSVTICWKGVGRRTFVDIGDFIDLATCALEDQLQEKWQWVKCYPKGPSK